MPPNPPRNAQRLRRAQDMSSTCAGRLLLALHNFPVFSLLLSIMPERPSNPSWVPRLAKRASVGDPQFSDFFSFFLLTSLEDADGVEDPDCADVPNVQLETDIATSAI